MNKHKEIKKTGYIISFDANEIECLLTKDYELDEILNFGRGLLTPQQDEMIFEGLIVRYNKDKGTIEFMLKDGNWC